MATLVTANDVDTIADHARPLTGAADDFDVLLDAIGDAHLVLLGEATHGTHEFYELRAAITRRLVTERGFDAVAVEADWPDAALVDAWVQGRDDVQTAEEALRGFVRFPRWMWRNTVVAELAGWLRDHNADGHEVGFYGLDLYSLHRSIEAVVAYLDTVDPAAAAQARERYSCLDHRGGDDDEAGQRYGRAAAFGAGRACEDAVVAQLVALQQRASAEPDAAFHAEQNARLVVDAERYYRTMFSGRVSSWNLRDEHMAATLEQLAAHLSRRKGLPAKLVVWEHNSHLGDARATEMHRRGEHNVGQLVREAHGDDAFVVGFTTYDGTVTAAGDWGGRPRRMPVVPALDGSVEALFHETRLGDFVAVLRDRPRLAQVLLAERLERAIGVVYRPQTERQSHYFRASLAQQFDAVVHVDRTRAVEPLDRESHHDEGGADAEDAPDTFPSGM